MVASDNPNILKLTSLQLGKISLNELSNTYLYKIFKLFAVQPENSGKILLSIPQ